MLFPDGSMHAVSRVGSPGHRAQHRGMGPLGPKWVSEGGPRRPPSPYFNLWPWGMGSPEPKGGSRRGITCPLLPS